VLVEHALAAAAEHDEPERDQTPCRSLDADGGAAHGVRAGVVDVG
jgi:hypothetical protein